LEKGENLSFSKEVAETLGLECAIILNLIKEIESSDISSQDRLLAYAVNALPFIDPLKIKKSIDKLNQFNLIDFDKESSKKDYVIKKPSKNLESRQIDPDWQPSEDTLEIVKMTSISNDFMNLKLKEFRIYWTERGQKKNNWNITFLDFIRREWAKENNSNKGLPYTINEKWFPDEDVFDILNLSDISRDSALKYLREFILYWKDKGTAFTTWNSKFIDHVKRRHMINANMSNNEKNKEYIEPGKYTKDFKTRKNDTTWANEISLD
jgi:hypothetical protein